MLIPVGDGTIFRAAEDFVDRYENVGKAGFQYFMFAPRKEKKPPYTLNTRVYSCILLRNDLPFRWRGRYNEDTDLSLRILKSGLCTILFNAFLCDKLTTMTQKGGNTDRLYIQNEGFDGRLEMAKSLVEQHPDVARISRKWDRYQHHVDYSKFRQQLVRREGLEIPKQINNYGMKLQEKINDEWTDVLPITNSNDDDNEEL
jgi:hypothetical protein